MGTMKEDNCVCNQCGSSFNKMFLLGKQGNVENCPMCGGILDIEENDSDWITWYYYQDLETFQNETAWEIADYSVKNLLFCQAYANEKDLNVTEAELDEQLESYASYYGISVEDGFTDAEIDAIKNTMMNLKVVDYIIENASVTIKEASEETETE